MSTDLNHIFRKFISNHLPDYENQRFILAVSGGIDSVVMCHLFATNQLHFEIAHCNFKLRGEDSDRDAEFVRELSKKWEVPFHIREFDTKKYATSHSLSVQMAARDLRYSWFEELLEKQSADYLCTAHHLDDSVETQWFNLIKGTGYKGIAGIPAMNGKIFRPLLSVSRHSIEEYAEEHKIEWRVDKSNDEVHYARNRIRHELIRSARKINPSYPNNHNSTFVRLRGADSLLLKYLDRLLEKLIVEDKLGEHLKINALNGYSYEEKYVLLQHWLGAYGYTTSDIENILEAFGTDSGKKFPAPGYLLVKDRSSLVLSVDEDMDPVEIDLEKEKGLVRFGKLPLRYFVVEKINWSLDKSGDTFQADFDKLSMPLVLRSWKQGDRFRPLGLNGEKKISDFMIDRKIPVNFKPFYPVVESGGNIAGIWGMQVDESFKVTGKTRRILVIKRSHA